MSAHTTLHPELRARIAGYAERTGSRATTLRGHVRAALAGWRRPHIMPLPGDPAWRPTAGGDMPRAVHIGQDRARRILARIQSGARCPRRASPALRAAYSAARLAAQAKRIAAHITRSYPYARPSGRWAGGDISARVAIRPEPGVSSTTEVVRSANGKWSGRDLSVCAAITPRAIRALGEDGLLLGGLLLLDAERVGPAEYRAVWAEQHGRLGLRPVSGWLIRDYHTRAATLDAARAEARAARERRAAVELRVRQQRVECGRVWVSAEDSLAAGNCPAGTEQVARLVRAGLGHVGAVRADVLLSIRDDYFSRRAVAVAGKRIKINQLEA